MAHDQDNQTLTQLLETSGGNGFAFLKAVFAFLDRETDFFEDPEASKQLARLLKLVKQTGPKAKPAAANGSALPQPSLSGVPLASAAANGHPAPKELYKNTKIEDIDDDMNPGPSTRGEAPAKEEDEGSKGLTPSAGNGATYDHYSWTQTLQEVVVTVPVPPSTSGKTAAVEITSTRLRVGLKEQPPLIDGELSEPANAGESLWSLVSTKNDDVAGKAIEITIPKKDTMHWWAAVIKGDPQIDVQKAMPENSKLSDLDGETRATVEKMMFDQQQKALGRPTTDERDRDAIFKKFKEAHPEMDFSQAKMM